MATEQRLTDFHINTRPVSIDFECPHCGCKAEIPWGFVNVPDYWGDDWAKLSAMFAVKP